MTASSLPRRRRSTQPAAEARTVAYIRVSTEDQAVNGVSLDAQEARIAAYCTAMGWDVSEVIRDAGASAKSLQRPGMSAIMAGLRDRSIGRVVVLKLDRLTRSVEDLSALLRLFDKSEAALCSISENLDTATACGRLLLNIMASVSQWEREAISERTADALTQKRHTRQVYGPVPFGYRREGDQLLPQPKEQAALTKAQAMGAAGASFREIGRFFDQCGVKPHRSSTWHANSVRAVLRSRMAREAVSA
jgi:DNA invertase Pin-like site-specific DNA recombinase